MLAKRVDDLPVAGCWIFEPKWDGFRALIFRDGDEIEIQSRDEKPLNRYFPEVVETLRSQLPPRCVLDGEIVIAQRGALNFDALQLRLHPAASRVRLLSQQIPGVGGVLRPSLRGRRRFAWRTVRNAPPEAGGYALFRGATHSSDARDPGIERRGGLVSPLRRRGTRRSDRQTRRWDIRVEQARDAQDQT